MTTTASAVGISTGRSPRRNQSTLIVAQLLSGVGIASGVAVGGLLAEEVSGITAAAGFAQTASVLGAGLVAMPLARLAGAWGRRWALGVGFTLGALGAVLILLAVASMQFWLLLLGMLAFGSATAAGLQSRYAATELAPPGAQARAMSIVVWATTVGSVAGPNLSEPGSKLGSLIGMNHLVGPYLFSLVAFISAALVVTTLRTGMVAGHDTGSVADRPRSRAKRIGAMAALRQASRRPNALFALVAITAGHMMMVSVMVMTPVHMGHSGMSLELVGIVISVHIIGMYAASPVFGWLADKIGPRRVALGGAGIFVIAFSLGAFDATAAHSEMPRISLALGVLGLGWSACLIGGSTLLNQSVSAEIRVPLQGASDSLMNFGAAIMAALAGPILAAGGFLAVNLVAALILIPLVIVGIRAVLREPGAPAGAAAPAAAPSR